MTPHHTGEDLTKAQRRRLQEEGDDWTRQEPDWKAGRTFLALEEMGFVEWKVKAAGDVMVGPGAHGHRWHTRRTEAGRSALTRATSGEAR